MSVLATLDYRLQTLSPAGLGLGQTNVSRFSPGAGVAGKRETVSLAGSAFTALSPPSGSKAVILILGAAVSLTLKGVTGDGTGIALTPATNPTGMDAIIPLGASPSVGILNGSASVQTIEALWL